MIKNVNEPPIKKPERSGIETNTRREQTNNGRVL